MAKNFFQDMIKLKSDIRKEISEKEALKNPPQKNPVASPSPKTNPEAYTSPPRPAPSTAPTPKNDDSWAPVVSNKVMRNVEFSPTVEKRRPRYTIWLAAAVSVVFLFFAVSFFLAQASITINPKTKDATFNQNFLASKEAAGENLVFDTIVISDEESKTVEGGQEQDVLIKAKGTVVIYNNYSTATQRLDIDTRLEGSNGKMYKTEKAVVVPGKKGETPGSVEVGIYANEAGEAYNSGPLDFQIFGFKGTPKYSKFYARSKGNISGGAKGKGSFIADEKKDIIINDMKATLQAKLLKKAEGLTPTGFVMFKDASILNIDSTNFDFTGAKDGLVPVSVKGSLVGVLFNEKDLTSKIVKLTVPDYDAKDDVYISNINDFQFTFLNKDGVGTDIKNINFNLSGSPKVVWKIDEAKLTGEVAGKSKKDFYDLLAQYPNVVSADVVLRPFWKRSFPGNKEDIEVIVNYPK